jgi:S1-C subfamily serine protease
MTVVALSDPSPSVQRLKEAMGAPEGVGVLVVLVAEGSPAAAAGIRVGDVILAVDDRPVDDLEAWQRLHAELAGRDDPLEFRVRTGTEESLKRVSPSGLRGTEQ